MAVVHDAQIVDEKLSSLDQTTFEWRNSGTGVLEEYEKEFLYRMLYGSQKIRNEKEFCRSQMTSGFMTNGSDCYQNNLGKLYFWRNLLFIIEDMGEMLRNLTHGSIASMIKKDII